MEFLSELKCEANYRKHFVLFERIKIDLNDLNRMLMWLIRIVNVSANENKEL